MQAMIFAAGLGTRLKPLTDTMPKALVRVGGKPLLEHVIINMKAAGVERIVVNVHHFSEQIKTFLAANDNFGIDIRVSDETSKLLETGGGIKKAVPLFDTEQPVLVHNVDILSNVNIGKFYYDNVDNDATLLVSSRNTKRYLLFDDGMSLKGWTNIETSEYRMRPADGEPPYAACIENNAPYAAFSLKRYAFSGIHIFSPRLFPLFKHYPDKFGIMDFYLGAPCGVTVKGCVKNDLKLMDVGKIDTLRDADDFVKTLSLA